MKKILCLVLALALLLSFAGCKQDKNRELYNLNLKKYVELGEYKGITVDTSSEEFKNAEQSQIDYDVEVNLFYKGTVKKGDVANIDYVGKKDGVAFEGGTAQGYDLEIGSGTFIPGFEEGLIGAKVGETVSLNITFPEEYQSEELAGQDVVFVVKVNYTDEKLAKEPKEYFKDMGFATVEEYYENVKQRAIEDTIALEVVEKSTIKSYPQEDLDKLFNFYYDTIKNNIEQSYGISMENYLSYVGQTEEDLKTSLIDEQIKPLMKQQMIWNAIFDKEGLELTEEDVDKKIKEIMAESGDTSLTRADIIEEFGEFYIENIVISQKVFEILEKSAVIS